MAKEMIISSNGFERRIAILEDGVLTEYYVERVEDESEGMVGNIYKGRVTKVLPGMQSAFVAIGLERDAFLYVADVFEPDEVEFETSPRESKSGAPVAKTAEAPAPASQREEIIDEEVEGILEAISQTDSRARVPDPDRLSPVSQRDYDEQVAELIESIAEDLDGSVSEEESVGAEVDLKDAIIEEKLIEAVQKEEDMTEELPEESPAVEEFRVGSLRIQFPSDTTLERIVDEPAREPETNIGRRVEELPLEEPLAGALGREESEPEALAPPPNTSPLEVTAAGEPSPGREHSSRLRTKETRSGEPVRHSTGNEIRSGGGEDPSKEPAGEMMETRSAQAAEAEPVLEDAEASVRHRSPRAHFAAHRKVRRRRSERGRQAEPNGGEAAPAPEPAMPTITELLHESQELLVQVAKEPIGNKGARVTSHIAIPGRYLVYMPTTEHIGVSRRIPSHLERIRLRKLAAKLRSQQKATGGFIVRTAAEGCREPDLLDDMKYLVRIWSDIGRRSEQVKAPALLYREVDLVQRILRDRLSGEFTAIRVDSEQEYSQIVDFVDHFQRNLLNRIKLYTRSTPIFEQYGIQSEIDKSIRPRVWLKSGGYIVINQTEALVAIDVNTGKFVGRTNRFEDTITRTNMEAAKEIARQIRLRDLGGIIVLDFIDMEERKNRQKVMQVLEDELKRDRAPAKILSFNDFGLVAITRKRVRQSLERTLCEPCPHCHGSGMIKSAQTICYEIFDEARRITDQVDKGKEVIVRVHPHVAQALQNTYTKVLEAIEASLKGNVTLETDPLLHPEQFDIALL